MNNFEPKKLWKCKQLWGLRPDPSCLLLLSNQNQSVYLYLFHIPTKFMIHKEKKHFSVVICVLYKYFFPWIAFSSVLRVTPKKILVNTSLISQFRENVSSFDFLANALLTYVRWIFGVIYIFHCKFTMRMLAFKG